MAPEHYPELPQEFPELDELAERAERGRMFYEMFPGTADSDRWLQQRRDMESHDHAETMKPDRGDRS